MRQRIVSSLEELRSFATYVLACLLKGIGVVGRVWNRDHVVGTVLLLSLFAIGAVPPVTSSPDIAWYWGLVFVSVIVFAIGAYSARTPEEDVPDEIEKRIAALSEKAVEAFTRNEQFFRRGNVERTLVSSTSLEELRLVGFLEKRVVDTGPPTLTGGGVVSQYDLTEKGIEALNRVCVGKPPSTTIDVEPIVVARPNRSPIQVVQRRLNQMRGKVRRWWDKEKHAI